jgi:hypothetical protein
MPHPPSFFWAIAHPPVPIWPQLLREPHHASSPTIQTDGPPHCGAHCAAASKPLRVPCTLGSSFPRALALQCCARTSLCLSRDQSKSQHAMHLSLLKCLSNDWSKSQHVFVSWPVTISAGHASPWRFPRYFRSDTSTRSKWYARLCWGGVKQFDQLLSKVNSVCCHVEKGYSSLDIHATASQDATMDSPQTSE